MVRDVARNHYEPLRSSVGSYVAETAFIGGANLLVEGMADQVLLAGLTSLLRHREVAPRKLLDLNDVTIVPAGSASSVPYIAYLARGRDEVKPACVALLDGDEAGQEAARKLRRSSDGNRKRILADEYVVDLARWATSTNLELAEGVRVTELEDLIPPTIAVQAARTYALRLLQASDDEVQPLKAELLTSKLGHRGEGSMWGALELTFAELFDGAHVDKVGFAKEVVNFIEAVREDRPRPPGLLDLEHNFGALLAELSDRLRQAVTEEAERRTYRRTDRIVTAFLRDFADAASRDAADQMLQEVGKNLEDTAGDEVVRRELNALHRDFKLSTDPLRPVAGFADFRQRLSDLGTKRRLAYREPAEGEARGPRRLPATD